MNTVRNIPKNYTLNRVKYHPNHAYNKIIIVKHLKQFLFTILQSPDHVCLLEITECDIVLRTIIDCDEYKNIIELYNHAASYRSSLPLVASAMHERRNAPIEEAIACFKSRNIKRTSSIVSSATRISFTKTTKICIFSRTISSSTPLSTGHQKKFTSISTSLTSMSS